MWRRVDLVSTDISEERQFTQDLHGTTSQKMAIFIVTTMKTSNLTFSPCLLSSLHLFANFINSAEVAKNIGEDSYGLIFGVNTFIALALQSVLTLIVVSDTGMALEIRLQVSGDALTFTLIFLEEEKLREKSYLSSYLSSFQIVLDPKQQFL
jgi:hypothetical protein